MKRWGRCGWLLVLVALLQGCGGADGDGGAQRIPATFPSFRVDAEPGNLPGTEGRRRAALAQDLNLDPEALLNWAEAQYRDLFPSGPGTQRVSHEGVNYRLRHYPATGNYIGVADDGGVWGYGPFTGSVLKSFGPMSAYACLVSPRSCEPSPVNCTTAVSTGFAGDLSATYVDAGGAAAGADGDSGSAGVGGSEGKVLGGRVKVIRLADGVVLGEGLTDRTDGLTTVKWCKSDLPVMLELSGAPGARYFDESVNDLVDFPLTKKLRALVDRFDENVGVSALTEAAFLYAMNNIVNDPSAIASGARPLVTDGVPRSLTAAQVQQVNALVLGEVNRFFTDSLQQPSIKALATPIDGRSGRSALASDRYGRMAALVGAFAKVSGLYARNSAAPAVAFSDQFSRDFTDGRVDGFALDESKVLSAGVRTYSAQRASLDWTLGNGLMGEAFGAQTTLPAVDNVIDSRSVVAPFAPCKDRQVSATYTLTRDAGVRAEVLEPVCGSSPERSVKVEHPAWARNIKSLSNPSSGVSVFGIGLDGSVVGWGASQCGAFPAERREGVFVASPLAVDGLSNVIEVVGAGSGAFLALNAAGEVFGWGRSDLGAGILTTLEQAGDPKCLPFVLRPTKFESLTAVVQILGTSDRALALTNGGDVLEWGFVGDAGPGWLTEQIICNIRGISPCSKTVASGVAKMVAVTGGQSIFALRRDGRVRLFVSADNLANSVFYLSNADLSRLSGLYLADRG